MILSPVGRKIVPTCPDLSGREKNWELELGIGNWKLSFPLSFNNFLRYIAGHFRVMTKFHIIRPSPLSHTA